MGSKMKFKVDQIAIAPRRLTAARLLLEEMGATEWIEDNVAAKGKVFDIETENEANLSFNYDLVPGKEFEILHYTDGPNWLTPQIGPLVSHLGMHVTASELEEWRAFFRERRIPVIQEVDTVSHTNPAIAGKRSYHYTIFGTRPILGVDLKFIVRKELEGN